jgi:hypothetical protein
VARGSTIDTLREQVEQGKYGKAQRLLWSAEQQAKSGTILDLQRFLEATSNLQSHLDGDPRQECARYIARASKRLKELRFGEKAIVALRPCRSSAVTGYPWRRSSSSNHSSPNPICAC